MLALDLPNQSPRRAPPPTRALDRTSGGSSDRGQDSMLPGVTIRRLTPIRAALVVVLGCLVAPPVVAQKSKAATDDADTGSELTHSRRVAVERFTGTGDVKAVREAVIAALEAEVSVNVASQK